MENNEFNARISKEYQEKISELYNQFLGSKSSLSERLLETHAESPWDDFEENTEMKTMTIDLEDISDEAKALVMNDLSIIHEEFLKFQSKIEHLGSSCFFIDAIEDFSGFLDYVGHLIEEFEMIEQFIKDNDNIEEVRDHMHKYEQLKQLNTNILVAVYLYYKGENL